MAAAGPLPSLTVPPRRSRRWTPWQELCFRLLEDAVKSASRDPAMKTPWLQKQALRQQARDQEWIDGVPAPLDFPTVCAVLDLEPTAVRRALRRK